MWLGFNWGFPSCPKGVYCSRRFAPIGASGERREMVKTPKEALALAKERGATMVDLKFMDFVGLWQHFTTPIQEIKEEIFEEGLGFDGSSIRGWAEIHNSDMLVFPDATTAVMDPFMKEPTLSLICNIYDPITKEAYARDPRNIAQKAEKYLKSTGIADTAYFGLEAEPKLLHHRFGRGSVEHWARRGGRQPRLQTALQGRLLPGCSYRQPSGHPHRDVPRDGRSWDRSRAAAS